MISVLNIYEQPVQVNELDLVDRHAAYGFIIHQAQLMVLDTRQLNGKYWLPGGYIESGEVASQTIVREALEESGHRVNVNQLIYEHSYNFAHPNQKYYRCHAKYYLCASEGLVATPPESIPISWLPVIEVSPIGFHLLIQDAVTELLRSIRCT